MLTITLQRGHHQLWSGRLTRQFQCPGCRRIPARRD
jgi:hypothetical protein